MPKTMGDLVRGERLGVGDYEVVIKSVEDTVTTQSNLPQVEFRSVTDEGVSYRWWKFLTPKAIVFLVKDLINAGLISDDTPQPESMEAIIETARSLAHELEGVRVPIRISERYDKKTDKTYQDTEILERTAANTPTESEALSRL